MNILLDLFKEDGGRPERVASTGGGEWATACPVCGGRDRFRVWPEEGEFGRYWCRGCGKGGDAIQYLRDIRGMSYQQACNFLGKEPKLKTVAGNKQSRWQPRKLESPFKDWIKKASSFLLWTRQQLFSPKGKYALEFLIQKRGLSENTIKTAKLGYNPANFWKKREDWGLPSDFTKDGKKRRLWLPKGITIPTYRESTLQRLRVRLQEPFDGISYCVISGSNNSISLVLGNNSERFIIVESELDGLLLHQELGDLATIVALGSAQIRPDVVTTKLLRESKLILVALDADYAGAKEAWQWWPRHFEQAERWAYVEGKDACEMWRAGVNLRYWFELALEQYSKRLESGKDIQQEAGQINITSLPPDFKNTKLILKLHSELLGEDFYLVANRELKSKVEAENLSVVVYLPHEIEYLSSLHLRELKRIHAVKKVFGGEVVLKGEAKDSLFVNQSEFIENEGIFNF